MTGHPSYTTVESVDVLDVSFLKVQMRTIATPRGDRVERVVIVHPGAVAVVPILDDDVVLIEQYRAAAGGFVLEIPAGKIDDPSHERLETAHRELEEETGLRAGSMTLLTELWTAVGFCDEQISIYLAEDLSDGVRAPVGAEEVDARIIRLPFAEAVQRVIDGQITDAKTVAGLLLTAGRRGPS